MGSRLRVSNRNFATSAYKDDHFSLSLLDFRANSRLIIPRGEKYRGGGNTLSLSVSVSLLLSKLSRANAGSFREAVGNLPRGESAMIKLSLYGNYAKHGNTARCIQRNAHSPAATIPSLSPSLSLSFSSFLSTLAFPHARRLQVNNNCVDKKLLQTQQRETEMNDVGRRGGGERGVNSKQVGRRDGGRR